MTEKFNVVGGDDGDAVPVPAGGGGAAAGSGSGDGDVNVEPAGGGGGGGSPTLVSPTEVKKRNPPEAFIGPSGNPTGRWTMDEGRRLRNSVPSASATNDDGSVTTVREEDGVREVETHSRDGRTSEYQMKSDHGWSATGTRAFDESGNLSGQSWSTDYGDGYVETGEVEYSDTHWDPADPRHIRSGRSQGPHGTQTWETADDGTHTMTSEDSSGRSTTTRRPDGSMTEESVTSEKTTTTETASDGATKTTTRYPDGRYTVASSEGLFGPSVSHYDAAGRLYIPKVEIDLSGFDGMDLGDLGSAEGGGSGS